MPAPTHQSNEAPLRSASWNAITYSCSILKADRRKGVKTSLTHRRISFRTLTWVAGTTYWSRAPREEGHRLLGYEKASGNVSGKSINQRVQEDRHAESLAASAQFSIRFARTGQRLLSRWGRDLRRLSGRRSAPALYRAGHRHRVCKGHDCRGAG